MRVQCEASGVREPVLVCVLNDSTVERLLCMRGSLSRQRGCSHAQHVVHLDIDFFAQPCPGGRQPTVRLGINAKLWLVT